jgi:hypothetical protein
VYDTFGLTVHDWYDTMAKNAQLTETLRMNVAAVTHAAQNAAGNDNSTFDDENVTVKINHLRYWYVCRGIGTEGPCMNAIPAELFHRNLDPIDLSCKFICPVCNAIYERDWGVFVEMQIKRQIHCVRSTVPDDNKLYIQFMNRELCHKDTSIAQALYNESSMIAPNETGYLRCVDSVEGQYRIHSALWYMALPTLPWSDVLGATFALMKSTSERRGSADSRRSFPDVLHLKTMLGLHSYPARGRR